MHAHNNPAVVCYSDAAWAVRKDGSSQSGFIVCLCDGDYLDGIEGPLSPISWGSGKTKRVCRSSLAAEIQGAGDGQEEMEFCRLLIYDILIGSLDLYKANEAISQVPGVLILDCKSLYDSVKSFESSALGMSDKRAAIEALALKRAVEPFVADGARHRRHMERQNGRADILAPFARTAAPPLPRLAVVVVAATARTAAAAVAAAAIPITVGVYASFT